MSFIFGLATKHNSATAVDEQRRTHGGATSLPSCRTAETIVQLDNSGIHLG
jgi:hypothetical protein